MISKRNVVNLFLSTKRFILPSPFNLRVWYQTFHSESRTTPRLLVNPRVCLYDVPTNIRVEGLDPLRPITLKAETFEDRGKLLHSNGHFLADDEGIVDISRSPSTGGSFKGIFPSGLLSMLKISSGNFEHGNLYKEKMHVPVKIKVSLQDGHIPVDANEPVIDTIELERHLIDSGVKRIPVREGRVRGVFYIPRGEGPFPGVIDMFGATGWLNENRAALNAARGIASLCLAYFNYEDIPAKKILNLDLDYFEEATEYLLSQPQVNSDKCGVIGNCLGGFIAYMMAIHLNKVKAAFIINAPFNPFEGDLTYKREIIARNLVRSSSEISECNEDGTHVPSRDFNEALSHLSQFTVDELLNTKEDTHFAVAIGEKSCYKLHYGWNELAKRVAMGKPNNFTLKIYHNAGHTIYPPYSPFFPRVYGKLWLKTHPNPLRLVINTGGDPLPSVSMQEDTWKWMLHFIETHLGKK